MERKDAFQHGVDCLILAMPLPPVNEGVMGEAE